MGLYIRVGKNEIAAMCILLLWVIHSFNFHLLCLTPKVWEVNKAVGSTIKKGEGGHLVCDWQSSGLILCWQCSSFQKCRMIPQALHVKLTKRSTHQSNVFGGIMVSSFTMATLGWVMCQNASVQFLAFLKWDFLVYANQQPKGLK